MHKNIVHQIPPIKRKKLYHGKQNLSFPNVHIVNIVGSNMNFQYFYIWEEEMESSSDDRTFMLSFSHYMI